MKLASALVACVLCVLAAGAGGASAADECRGLQVCISVPGPWVTVPAQGGTRSATQYLLACPGGKGVVGGVDAVVSDRALDITFSGRLGSPVGPGVTTERAALFSALYTGATAKTTTFRPYLGCIPTSGGGGRSTTAVTLKPGHPVTLRAKTVRLVPGSVQRVTRACAAGERLVSSWHAVAFRTTTAPNLSWLSAITTSRSVQGTRATVRVTTNDVLPPASRAEVQVGAACAR